MGKCASRHLRRRKSTGSRYKIPSVSEESKQKSSLKKDKVAYPNVTSNCHCDAISSLYYVKDYDYLLSGGKDGLIVLQDLKSANIVHKWGGHTRDVTKVRNMKDFCISSSRDKEIKIWNIDHNICKATLSGHTLAVTGIDIDSHCSNIISGSRDNSVRLWDVETETCLHEEVISRNLVTDLKLSEHNKLVVQTSEDKMIKLWDADNLELLHTFPTQTQIQTSCTVFENYFLTTNNGFGGSGCEICLWDIRQRKLLQTFRGHKETVSGCSGIYNTEYFISSSHDSSIKLWKYGNHNDGDINKNSLLSSIFIGGSGIVTCVQCINEDVAVCGTFDGGIKTLTIKNNTLLQLDY